MKKQLYLIIATTIVLSACGNTSSSSNLSSSSSSIAVKSEQSSSISSTIQNQANNTTNISSSVVTSSSEVLSASISSQAQATAEAPLKANPTVRYFLCQNKEDMDKAIELPNLDYPFAVNTKLELPLVANERIWGDKSTERFKKNTKSVYFFQEGEVPFLFVHIARPENLNSNTKSFYDEHKCTSKCLYKVSSIRDSYIRIIVLPVGKENNGDDTICLNKADNAFDYYDVDGNLLTDPEKMDAYSIMKKADSKSHDFMR